MDEPHMDHDLPEGNPFDMFADTAVSYGDTQAAPSPPPAAATWPPAGCGDMAPGDGNLHSGGRQHLRARSAAHRPPIENYRCTSDAYGRPTLRYSLARGRRSGVGAGCHRGLRAGLGGRDVRAAHD